MMHITKRGIGFGVAMLFAFSLVLPGKVVADVGEDAWIDAGAADNQELLDQIGRLTARVEELEARLSDQPAPVDSDRIRLLEDRISAAERVAPGGGGFELASPEFLRDVAITGFVDTSYTFNFNQPDGGTNVLHSLDPRSNDFTLNNVEISLSKAPDPIGWKLDLDFGNNSESTNSAGLGTTDDELDIQEAYVVYTLPMEKLAETFTSANNVTGELIMGKFTTMAGAEVIEAVDNWNFSRSFLFGLAIPFAHTGVRANWNVDGWLDLVTGVSNGWDIHDDNNQAKLLELAAGFSPTKWWSQNIAYYMGSERAAKDGNQRHLIDLVSTITNPWPEIEWLNPATVMVNLDWGREQDAQRFDQGGVQSLEQNDPNVNTGNIGRFGDSEARWWGLAGYLKYDINDWWSVANRLEIFRDIDGSRTQRQQDLWEYTLTNEFKLIENLITRLEYRHDASTEEVFGKTERFVDDQDIVYLEAIVTF